MQQIAVRQEIAERWHGIGSIGRDDCVALVMHRADGRIDMPANPSGAVAFGGGRQCGAQSSDSNDILMGGSAAHSPGQTIMAFDAVMGIFRSKDIGARKAEIASMS